MTRPTIAIISGPSCSGKSSLQKALIDLGYAKVVTHTTRKPRAGEINGVDYNFVVVDEFSAMLRQQHLLESEQVGADFYGTSESAVEKALRESGRAVLVMEPKGAAKVAQHFRHTGTRVVRIWIGCEPAEIAKRFMQRYQGDPIGGQKRLSVMLGIEQDWIREAAEGGRYHLYLRGDLESPAYLAHVTDKFISTLAA